MKYRQHNEIQHSSDTYLTSGENRSSFLLLPLLIIVITRIVVLVIVILTLAHSNQVLFVLVRGGPGPRSLQTQEGMSAVMETGEPGKSLDQGLLHQGPDTAHLRPGGRFKTKCAKL